MINIVEEDYFKNAAKVALRINRLKRNLVVVIGIGYPFIRKERYSLAALCDFFVDDSSYSDIEAWSKKYFVVDYRKIDFGAKGTKYVLIKFSENRDKLLKKIICLYPDIEVYDISERVNTVCSCEDAIESKNIHINAFNKNSFNIIDTMAFFETCTIDVLCEDDISIVHVRLNNNSKLSISSSNNCNIDSAYLGEKTSIAVGNNAGASIRNCEINNDSKINVYSGFLKMEDVYIGERCVIHAYKNINIGSGTIISWNVSIMDGDGHSITHNKKINRPQDITIKENVWIGNNSIILKGVTVGQGSVVAAGSVVTKDVPPRTIVAGNPARVIKEKIEWKYGYDR